MWRISRYQPAGCRNCGAEQAERCRYWTGELNECCWRGDVCGAAAERPAGCWCKTPRDWPVSGPAGTGDKDADGRSLLQLDAHVTPPPHTFNTIFSEVAGLVAWYTVAKAPSPRMQSTLRDAFPITKKKRLNWKPTGMISQRVPLYPWWWSSSGWWWECCRTRWCNEGERAAVEWVPTANVRSAHCPMGQAPVVGRLYVPALVNSWTHPSTGLRLNVVPSLGSLVQLCRAVVLGSWAHRRTLADMGSGKHPGQIPVEPQGSRCSASPVWESPLDSWEHHRLDSGPVHPGPPVSWMVLSWLKVDSWTWGAALGLCPV